MKTSPKYFGVAVRP